MALINFISDFICYKELMLEQRNIFFVIIGNNTFTKL